MTRSLILVAILTLAGLASARADDCNHQYSAPWASAGAGYTIDAIADGPSCAKAIVALALRAPDGKTLATYMSEGENLQFLDIKTSAAMKKALAEWVTRDQKRLSTTGALPDWKDKADQPGGGDETFYVSEGLKRADYLAIRKARRPMFCWVSGRESQACMYLSTDGKAKELGGYALPG